MDEPPDDPQVDDLADAIEAALGWAGSLGLVSITEAGMPDWRYWDALVRLRDEGRLPVRVRVLVASGTADLGRMDEARSQSDGPLSLEGVKLYADGWLGPRTCACSKPFIDGAEPGLLFLDADTLARRAEPYAAAGFTVATHAIGDRAIAAALDAYERLYGSGDAVAAAAPRVEHAQLLTPALIDRLAATGAVACIQPCFAASDAAALDAALDGLFPAAYRWDLMLGAGARLLAGSDYPIETLDPAAGLAALTSGLHPLAPDVARRLMTSEEPVTLAG